MHTHRYTHTMAAYYLCKYQHRGKKMSAMIRGSLSFTIIFNFPRKNRMDVSHKKHWVDLHNQVITNKVRWQPIPKTWGEGLVLQQWAVTQRCLDDGFKAWSLVLQPLPSWFCETWTNHAWKNERTHKVKEWKHSELNRKWRHLFILWSKTQICQ